MSILRVAPRYRQRGAFTLLELMINAPYADPFPLETLAPMKLINCTVVLLAPLITSAGLVPVTVTVLASARDHVPSW